MTDTLVLWGALLVNVVAHETAHALVAARFGGKVEQVTVGCGTAIVRGALGQIRVTLRVMPLAGFTLWRPPSDGRARKRARIAVPLAGPFVTLALAAALAKTGWLAASAAWQCLALLGVLGLLPFVPTSDAAAAWTAWRTRPTTETAR